MSDIIEQIGLETRMRKLAIDQYRRDRTKAEEKKLVSYQGAGLTSITLFIDPLAAAIAHACDRRKKGRTAGWVKKMRLAVVPNDKTRMDPDYVPAYKNVDFKKIALIVVRTTQDEVCGRMPLAALGKVIGGKVQDQIMLTTFERSAGKDFGKAMKKIASSQNYSYKHKVMIGLQNKNDQVKPWIPWTLEEKVTVGTELLDLLRTLSKIDAEGNEVLFTLIERVKNAKGQYCIKKTKEFEDMLEEEHERVSDRNPHYLPSLSEPVEWGKEVGGGWHTIDQRLVKTKPSTGQGDPNIKPAQAILNTINAVQNTPWRINAEVLVTLKELWDIEDLELPKIPQRVELIEPARPGNVPAKLKTKDMTEDQLKSLYAFNEAKKIYRVTKDRNEQRLAAARKILKMSSDYAQREKFYFVHQYDFRGRLYALTRHLSPQGPDFGRGLLEFATPKPLGTQAAADYFQICGAQHFGEEDGTLKARWEWTVNHEEQILEVFDDPISNKWWMEADEPYQFLQFCLAWGQWHETGYDLSWECRKVIPLDGSANGTQHLAALIRDEEAAEACNMLPGHEPRDIYQDIVDAVKVEVEILETGYDPNDRKLAREWLKSGLLVRKALKKQVMTTNYAITKYGMRDQLVDYLEELAGEGKPVDLESIWLSCNWLNEIIYRVIGTKLSGPRKVMEWLKECATRLSKKGLPIKWQTPHGFRCTQAYRTETKSKITTHLSGTIQLVLYKPTERIHKGQARSGISANLVHSLDGCHLSYTINEVARRSALAESPASFAVIHDSFGVHAADTPLLAEVLRSEFISMYQKNDPLDQLKTKIEIETHIEMPELPEKGELDLASVADSAFFFA
jgi:DNA-directed RNA polymerase